MCAAFWAFSLWPRSTAPPRSMSLRRCAGHGSAGIRLCPPLSAQWCPLGVVLFFNVVPAALLAHVFAQQLTGLGVEQTSMQLIPLHSQHAPDPAKRCAIECGLDFDVAIQMNDALAVPPFPPETIDSPSANLFASCCRFGNEEFLARSKAQSAQACKQCRRHGVA